MKKVLSELDYLRIEPFTFIFNYPIKLAVEVV